MSSDNLNLISEILSKINKLLSKPVCAPELTKYSKLVQQYSQLVTEVDKAGRLGRRGLKKQQEQLPFSPQNCSIPGNRDSAPAISSFPCRTADRQR